MQACLLGTAFNKLAKFFFIEGPLDRHCMSAVWSGSSHPECSRSSRRRVNAFLLLWWRTLLSAASHSISTLHEQLSVNEQSVGVTGCAVQLVSTNGTTHLGEVRSCAPGCPAMMFQLYIYTDRRSTVRLIRGVLVIHKSRIVDI